MKPLLQLIVYVFFVLFFYFIAVFKMDTQSKTLVLMNSNINSTDNVKRFTNNKFLSLIKIIIIAFLFGLYSIYVSQEPLGLDRRNYAIRYSGQWEEPWTLGLNFVAKVLQAISTNYNLLFFSVPFICVIITLIAYKKSKDATPKSLLLLLSSNYFIHSLYLFKQAPAISFSSLAFVTLINKKNKMALLFVIISILFHESAIILLPIFILVINFDKKIVRVLSVIAIMIIFLFYPVITDVLVNNLTIVFPFLETELAGYGFSLLDATYNWATIFRGIPYYWITLYAVINRKELRDKITNFDLYLFSSFIASIGMALSFYMYWMFRFSTYFYFPTLIFAALIMKETRNTLKKFIFEIGTFISLGFLSIRYLIQILFIHGGF